MRFSGADNDDAQYSGDERRTSVSIHGTNVQYSGDERRTSVSIHGTNVQYSGDVSSLCKA